MEVKGMHGKFVTGINCMDGRVQLPVIEYLKDKYGADYVDMITEPGPIKILSENEEKFAVESMRNRARISAECHGSGLVAVVGHYDCAGNPVCREVQRTQTLSAMEVVRSWKLHGQIIGLWVDENWEVCEI
jgi:hypothetical protein